MGVVYGYVIWRVSAAKPVNTFLTARNGVVDMAVGRLRTALLGWNDDIIFLLYD
jgi:hypothetical protein